MYKMVPLSDFVSLSQGLAINKGTAHLVSEEKKTVFHTLCFELPI